MELEPDIGDVEGLPCRKQAEITVTRGTRGLIQSQASWLMGRFSLDCPSACVG